MDLNSMCVTVSLSTKDINSMLFSCKCNEMCVYVNDTVTQQK